MLDLQPYLDRVALRPGLLFAETAAALAGRWYDEADLYATATASVERAAPEGVRSLVLHLPVELHLEHFRGFTSWTT